VPTGRSRHARANCTASGRIPFILIPSRDSCPNTTAFRARESADGPLHALSLTRLERAALKICRSAGIARNDARYAMRALEQARRDAFCSTSIVGAPTNGAFVPSARIG